MISWKGRLEFFWRNIDPTAVNRQFVDVGTQYRGAIFYHSDEQRALALASKEASAASGKFDQPVVTEITALDVFYPEEGFHQKYYQKDPQRSLIAMESEARAISPR